MPLSYHNHRYHRYSVASKEPPGTTMAPPPKEETGFNAIKASQDLSLTLTPIYKPATSHQPSETLSQRQHASTATDSLENDSSLPTKVLDHPPTTAADDIESLSPNETVLYLAYGSNLFSETFLGQRGIRPFSQVNVLVPELRLTFDMPGLPYAEPCFAATRFQSEVEELCGEEEEDEDEDYEGEEMESEKAPLMLNQDYQKDLWHKPLIGVVYEVSLADYARIIASEGAGRGYRDMIVDCYPFPKSYSPTDPVPDVPDTKPFRAHSLLSPAVGGDGKNSGVRPNPWHAQPSTRYLNLLTSGAAEHDLPLSYREYLGQFRPFRITTTRQKIGKVLFLILWGPTFMMLMGVSQLLAGPDGRSPAWLIAIIDLIYGVMWWSYDTVFVKWFGEGERTIGDT